MHSSGENSRKRKNDSVKRGEYPNFDQMSSQMRETLIESCAEKVIAHAAVDPASSSRPGRDRSVRERSDDAVLVAAVAAVAVASVVVIVVVAVVAVVAVRDPRQSRHRSGSGGVRGHLSPRELRTPAFAFALASSTSSYVAKSEVRVTRVESTLVTSLPPAHMCDDARLTTPPEAYITVSTSRVVVVDPDPPTSSLSSSSLLTTRGGGARTQRKEWERELAAAPWKARRPSRPSRFRTSPAQSSPTIH